MTDVAASKVPAAGLNWMSATLPVMVNCALTTGESFHPVLTAIARIVVVSETVMAPVYSVPVVAVGTEPSVV